MKTKLTEEDIKKLRYQFRPGIVIGGLIFIIGFAVTLLSITENDIILTLLVFVLTVVLSVVVVFLIIGKYQKDISNKEKILEAKTIQKKKSITDYEAGSGTMYPGQKMKGFDSYSIIIDNTRYRVDKDFYETCNAGEKVTFHIAPKSKHRLRMELNKNKLENKIF